MTTVGYGELTADTVPEMIASTLAMLIGATTFGYVIGSISGLVQRINAAGARFAEKIEEVIEYLQDRRVPTEVSTVVI